jgi:hypothetical protein
VGDGILTRGSISLLQVLLGDPGKIRDRWVRRQIYRLIHKRHKDLGRKYIKVIHVAGYVGADKFAEITYPKPRYGDISEYNKQELIICRPTKPFHKPLYLDTWAEMIDEQSDYDIGELFEHADGWLGEKFDKLINFDDGKRYVCSSGYGRALIKAEGDIGWPNQWVGVDPAWFAEERAPFNVLIVPKAIA